MRTRVVVVHTVELVAAEYRQSAVAVEARELEHIPLAAALGSQQERAEGSFEGFAGLVGPVADKVVLLVSRTAFLASDTTKT